MHAIYKYLVVSARHAGSTHESTDLQSSKIYELLMCNKLPDWTTVAADDAYRNSGHALTLHGGTRLTQVQDPFIYYLSPCVIAMEQPFVIFISRFGILWSPLCLVLPNFILVILIACKLQNFIILMKEVTV